MSSFLLGGGGVSNCPFFICGYLCLSTVAIDTGGPGKSQQAPQGTDILAITHKLGCEITMYLT